MSAQPNSSSGFPKLIGDLTKAVSSISESMAIWLENYETETPQVVAHKLSEHFRATYERGAYQNTGIDSHISDGLYKEKRGHDTRESENPRLVDLVLLHVNEAAHQAKRVAKGYLLLPSPLLIAIEALTIPDEPHSGAYPLIAARLLLSQRLGVWPRNAFVDSVHSEFKTVADEKAVLDGKTIVDEKTIIEEIRNCRTLVEYGDIWSIKADLKKRFIAHYLAARGTLLFRFTKSDAIAFLREGIFSAGWNSGSTHTREELQLRLSQKYAELPQPSEFMNEILGIPIALRGTNIVFMNGLKPSVKDGLVIQLAGGAGTGKTTLALSLAAALAPLGTQTLYFSVEEAKEDLVTKLRQQSQPRLDVLSYRSETDDEWFNPFSVLSKTLTAIESEVIAPLNRHINEAKKDWPSRRDRGALIPPVPFLVVLDSLSALPREENPLPTNNQQVDRTHVRNRLAAFVEECRKLQVLVLLITSENHSTSEDLDYLVDTVITLRVEGGSDHQKKPVRLFQLSKSRHQISRHGTHIFHLSGDSGFRLAPQLSSQMDALQYHRRQLWDRHIYSEALNIRRKGSGRFKHESFLKIHSQSQIILQGRGSSGKAGLAMKIALSPLYEDRGFVENQRVPRVLIISFLYPPAYYERLREDVLQALEKEATASADRGFNKVLVNSYIKRTPKATVIHLTPGVLHAEDLYSMLTRRLEEGRLMGIPYTAVIIDGLHNLALQFPGTEESSYLFPIIYGTLSRANVMTIATFTTLALRSSDNEDTNMRIETASADINEESLFRLKGHLPLLHTLVQASDYTFEVSPYRHSRKSKMDTNITNNKGEAYLLWVHSAVSTDPPLLPIGWRRNDFVFTEPGWGYEDPQRELEI